MHNRFWTSWLFFTGLAALILGPLLGPGYVLTLDLSWGPHFAPPDFSNNDGLLLLALQVLGAILPSWVVEKLVLVLIFVLAGVGLQRLASRANPGWPSFVAGVLFVVNPFTYERLMAGQWLVLAGYALLPWFLAAVISLIERPGLRRSLVLAAWGLAISVVSLHTLPMAGLLALAVVVAKLWGHPQQLRRVGLWTVVSLSLWLAASAMWLVPLALPNSPTTGVVAAFDEAQFRAFRTAAGPLGAPLNTLALQGFWGEDRSVLVPASVTGGWFWLAFGLVAVAVGAGTVLAIRRRHRVALALAVVAVVAWILALGIATPPTEIITRFLVDHLPFYRGYREPAKWLAVVALAYAYLASFSLAALSARLHGYWSRAGATACLLVPFIWVPLMIWGAAGQLRSTDYPASWYQLAEILSNLPPATSPSPDTLVLPWHQYLYLDFAGRAVANPAPGFFKRPVIVSNDPEVLGVPPAAEAGLVTSIQKDVINRRFFGHNAGSTLHELGVNYVVLLKLSDWSDYKWLNTQTGLKLIEDHPQWQLFQTSARP